MVELTLVEWDADAVELDLAEGRVPKALDTEGMSAHDYQELEALCRSIQRLPSKCRKVFVLRKVHGLSYDKIAESLGVTRESVKGYMRQATSQLSNG